MWKGGRRAEVWRWRTLSTASTHSFSNLPIEWITSVRHAWSVSKMRPSRPERLAMIIFSCCVESTSCSFSLSIAAGSAFAMIFSIFAPPIESVAAVSLPAEGVTFEDRCHPGEVPC